MKKKLLSKSPEELDLIFNSNSQQDPLLRIKRRCCSLLKYYKINSEISNKDLAQALGIDESNLSKIIIASDEVLNKKTIDFLLRILIKIQHKDDNIEKFVRDIRYL